MPRQLIYTSAPRGLTPGQSGYCTVARSRELREGLIPKLEKLSYYTAESNANPTICAHRIVEVRGTKFHVLTRIVDAGLDFTKRRSFLAHHLIFDPDELHDAAVPAQIFLHWKGWLENWQADPQWLEENRPLPARAHSESRMLKHDLWISGVEGDRENFLPALAERGADWEITFTNCFQPGDNAGDFDIKAAWPNTAGYEAAQRVGAEFIRPSEIPFAAKRADPIRQPAVPTPAGHPITPRASPNWLIKLLPFVALLAAALAFAATMYYRNRTSDQPIAAVPAPPIQRNDSAALINTILPDRATWLMVDRQPAAVPPMETLISELRANEVFTKDLTCSIQTNLEAPAIRATLFAEPERRLIRFTATNAPSIEVTLTNGLVIVRTELHDSFAADIPGRFRLLAIKSPVELPRSLLVISTNIELDRDFEDRVHRLEIPSGAQFALRPLVQKNGAWTDPVAKAAHDLALVPSTILDLGAVDARARQIVSDKGSKLRALENEETSLADAQKRLVTEAQTPEQSKQNDRLHALQLAIPKARKELESLRAKAAEIPRDAARIDGFALFLCLSNVNTEVFRFIDKP